MNEKGAVTQTFILYGTSACHLCDTAESMLIELNRRQGGLAYEKSDIALSDDLFDRYSLHIPVLQHPTGKELFWPFDAAALTEFCRV
ncbi:MAG: glutaredoxin family protein [Halioglobus sp.]